MPELTKLDRTTSMIRYFPPKGTAGFARSFVKGCSLSPRPPAIIIPRTVMRLSPLRLVPAAWVGIAPLDRQRSNDGQYVGIQWAEMVIILTSAIIDKREQGEYCPYFHADALLWIIAQDALECGVIARKRSDRGNLAVVDV